MQLSVPISDDDYKGLAAHQSASRVRPVFVYCQEHFGGLPGFSRERDLLIAPEGYAESDGLFTGAFLVEP